MTEPATSSYGSRLWSTRLLRTSSFRLTLLYASLFTVSVLVLATIIYAEVVSFAVEQQEEVIQSEYEAVLRSLRRLDADRQVALIAERTEHPRALVMRYLLQDAQGQVLAGNLPRQAPKQGRLRLKAPRLSDPKLSSDIRARGIVLENGRYLIVGQGRKAQSEREELAKILARDFGYAFSVTLLLAIIGGALISASLLRRIEAVSRTAREIMQGDLSQRLPTRGVQDEFDQLSGSVNAILDRLQAQVEAMRQVSSDIAHDLRTPLTHLRHHLERAQSLKEPEALREAFTASAGEVDAILSTFNSLLRIAQLEGGVRHSPDTPVDCAELLGTLIEVYQPLFDARSQTLEPDIAEGLPVSGDRNLLAQMLGNLIENASRHTPDGSSVRIRARLGGGMVRIDIIDNGPGIPVEEHDRVFRRLYRLERSRTSPGSGLGLSLVAAIAQLHEASIALADMRPGLRVTIMLKARNFRTTG